MNTTPSCFVETLAYQVAMYCAVGHNHEPVVLTKSLCACLFEKIPGKDAGNRPRYLLDIRFDSLPDGKKFKKGSL